MPQEFHVIRCFSCKTFQVHIVKKSNKWICKMCGEKQSLKKVYSHGSGKDCRIHVQALNQNRMIEENISFENVEETEHYENHKPYTQDTSNLVQNESKWSEYLEEKKELSESDEDNNDQYTFQRPNKRKFFNKKEQYTNNKKLKPNIDVNSENVELYNDAYSEKNKIIPDAEDERVLNKPSKWDSFIQIQEDETPSENNEKGLEITSNWNSCVKNNENTSNLGLNIYNCTDVNTLDDIFDI